MNIVLIDNYDSFTHNLAQYLLEQKGVDLVIVENDDFQLADLEGFDKIVISPGPGVPSTAGLIIEAIRHFSGIKPILGICLGLQAIYEASGGRLLNLPVVQHGVSSTISIVDKNDPIFRGISSPFNAGRYHSWVCDPVTLPRVLKITALDKDNTIMACRHVSHATYGVQFHPESILTPEGKKMIKNFVEL
jgi:anthranilate synthase component 2